MDELPNSDDSLIDFHAAEMISFSHSNDILLQNAQEGQQEISSQDDQKTDQQSNEGHKEKDVGLKVVFAEQQAQQEDLEQVEAFKKELQTIDYQQQYEPGKDLLDQFEDPQITLTKYQAQTYQHQYQHDDPHAYQQLKQLNLTEAEVQEKKLASYKAPVHIYQQSNQKYGELLTKVYDQETKKYVIKKFEGQASTMGLTKDEYLKTLDTQDQGGKNHNIKRLQEAITQLQFLQDKYGDNLVQVVDASGNGKTLERMRVIQEQLALNRDVNEDTLVRYVDRDTDKIQLRPLKQLVDFLGYKEDEIVRILDKIPDQEERKREIQKFKENYMILKEEEQRDGDKLIDVWDEKEQKFKIHSLNALKISQVQQLEDDEVLTKVFDPQQQRLIQMKQHQQNLVGLSAEDMRQQLQKIQDPNERTKELQKFEQQLKDLKKSGPIKDGQKLIQVLDGDSGEFKLRRADDIARAYPLQQEKQTKPMVKVYDKNSNNYSLQPFDSDGHQYETLRSIQQRLEKIESKEERQKEMAKFKAELQRIGLNENDQDTKLLQFYDPKSKSFQMKTIDKLPQQQNQIMENGQMKLQGFEDVGDDRTTMNPSKGGPQQIQLGGNIMGGNQLLPLETIEQDKNQIKGFHGQGNDLLLKQQAKSQNITSLNDDPKNVKSIKRGQDELVTQDIDTLNQQPGILSLSDQKTTYPELVRKPNKNLEGGLDSQSKGKLKPLSLNQNLPPLLQDQNRNNLSDLKQGQNEMGLKPINDDLGPKGRLGKDNKQQITFNGLTKPNQTVPWDPSEQSHPQNLSFGNLANTLEPVKAGQRMANLKIEDHQLIKITNGDSDKSILQLDNQLGQEQLQTKTERKKQLNQKQNQVQNMEESSALLSSANNTASYRVLDEIWSIHRIIYNFQLYMKARPNFKNFENSLDEWLTASYQRFIILRSQQSIGDTELDDRISKIEEITNHIKEVRQLQTQEEQGENGIRKYRGQTDQNKLHGRAISMVKRFGAIYDGLWYQDKFLWGWVLEVNPADQLTFYQGSYDRGQKYDLNATMTWYEFTNSLSAYCTKDPNFEKIEIHDGSFKHGQITGFGRREYQSRDIYEGEWFQGKKQGKGVLTFATNDKYEGQFYDGYFHGEGEYTNFRKKIKSTGQYRKGVSVGAHQEENLESGEKKTVTYKD